MRGKTMILPQNKDSLSSEEKFVALVHIYLDLHLSLQGAMDAATADLVHLDSAELVAEAA
jgi:hypothetical protein